MAEVADWFASCAFDDWVRRVFIDSAPREEFISLDGPTTDAGAEVVLGHCTRLFRDPVFLLDLVPKDALRKVLWAFPGIDGCLNCLCCDALSRESRSECVALTYELFEKLFRPDRAAFLDGACFMWWEHLVGIRWHWDTGPYIGQIPWLISDVIRLCERLLEIDSARMQRSALHGLNEFYVEDGSIERIVDDYLARNPHLDEVLRSYAMQCRACDAQ